MHACTEKNREHLTILSHYDVPAVLYIECLFKVFDIYLGKTKSLLRFIFWKRNLCLTKKCIYETQSLKFDFLYQIQQNTIFDHKYFYDLKEKTIFFLYSLSHETINDYRQFKSRMQKKFLEEHHLRKQWLKNYVTLIFYA